MSALIDLTGRLSERGRRSRNRRVRIIAIVVVVLALLVGSAWAATSSPLLAARKVEVTGQRAVPAETILQKADVPLGVPLARIDTRGVAERVRTVAGIGDARVGVRLPDTVTIQVTERPVAYVVAGPGSYEWVDPTGGTFNRSTKPPAGVPRAVLGTTDQALRADVGTVATALTPGLRAKVKRINARSREAIQLELNTGAVVVWGSADNSALKAEVAEALLSVEAKVYDVSAPSNPTTRGG